MVYSRVKKSKTMSISKKNCHVQELLNDNQNIRNFGKNLLKEVTDIKIKHFFSHQFSANPEHDL